MEENKNYRMVLRSMIAYHRNDNDVDDIYNFIALEHPKWFIMGINDLKELIQDLKICPICNNVETELVDSTSRLGEEVCQSCHSDSF